MNQLLFSIDEQHVSMDGGYSFCLEPTEYSVMYDIHKISGRDIVILCLSSVKRQEWRDGKAEWVAAQLDAPVLMRIEKQLQDEVDYENEMYIAELAEEYHRRRA